MEAVSKAFTEFEKFRIKEGEMLADELSRMTQAIVQLVKEIELIEPERMETIRAVKSVSNNNSKNFGNTHKKLLLRS